MRLINGHKKASACAHACHRTANRMKWAIRQGWLWETRRSPGLMITERDRVVFQRKINMRIESSKFIF